ncbi:MAG: hypothetical protein ABR588_08795 [Sphingomicrobium sp.]|nr:helix-turn-helix domain-containing protein [Sphingomonadales bacterium]
MPKDATEDMLGVMIALSDQVPDAPLQGVCWVLAQLVAEHRGKLGEDLAKKLLVTGATIWNHSKALGEDFLDIQHITSGEQ